MKKFMRHICAAALVLVCCTSFLASASALERASSYIAKYTANVTAAGGGKVQVMFSIVANKRVSQLGASYILLEESDDGGRTWNTAEEYESESWMTSSNRSTYNSAIIYQGTVGHQYRVTAEVLQEMKMVAIAERLQLLPLLLQQNNFIKKN